MGASERLSLEQVRASDVLSASHLHRYELAASLCGGCRVLDLACGVGYGADIIARRGAASIVGVDIDESAIEEAQRTFARDGVRFEAGDAIERLRRLDPEEIDVVVAFEALEHLERLDEALTLLRDHAAAGVRLVLSVPNSRTFHEENEFHVTDFGYDEMRETFERFDGAVILCQHLAEGSVLTGAGEGLTGRVGAPEYAEPEYANNYIAVIGFGDGAVGEATAQLNLVTTPSHNRYMLELQAANEELRAANRRLSQAWLGVHDAAAASIVARYERDQWRLRQLEEQFELQEGGFLATVERYEKAIEMERAWRDAPRYKAVDAVRDRLLKLPGFGGGAERAWRRVAGR